MSVRKKLNIGFISIGSILLLALIFTSAQFFRIGESVNHANNVQSKEIAVFNKIQIQLNAQNAYARTYISDSSSQNKDLLLDSTLKLTEAINAIPKDTSSEINNTIQTIRNHNETLSTYVDLIIKSMGDQNISSALTLVNSDYNYTNQGIANLSQKLIDYKNGQLVNDIATAERSINVSLIFSIIMVFLTIILVVSFLLYIKRGITSPLV